MARDIESRPIVRKKIIQKYNISEDNKIFLHTGKLPGRKKSKELIKAFSNTNGKYTLLITGSLDSDFKIFVDNVTKKKKNIIFCGWKSVDELRDYMLGSDFLIQPGSLSNSFIDAICCGLPLILHNTPQGVSLTSYGNGLLLSDNSAEYLESFFKSV